MRRRGMGISNLEVALNCAEGPADCSVYVSVEGRDVKLGPADVVR